MQFALDPTTLEVLQQYSSRPAAKPPCASPDLCTATPSYRYEGDGIVVYDSKARLPDDPPDSSFLPCPRDPANYDRKDLELASDFDKRQFFALPRYPCFKPRVYESTLVLPESALRFDSHFEAGNLAKVVQVSPGEYRLWLEFDVNTQGHTQWYYFSVRNRQACSVTFAIDNLMKYDSLYLNGMQPLVYSKNREGCEGVRWHRAGSRIAYVRNETLKPDQKAYYYTLSFDYHFQYPNDTVYFAHCYPYTHTDLMRDLAHYQEDTRCRTYFRVDTLCMTLAGNPCPVITITSEVGTYQSWEYEHSKMMKSAAGRRMMRLKEGKEEESSHKSKRAVILTARVHPGESNSSFMMKGALEFLLSPSKEAKVLRREYVFKLIPMLNPDGVIYGNYRCSLLGADLNRRWLAPNRILHPTIYHSKRLIQMVAEEREVVLFCDMHGHSMRKNVFVYGCSERQDRKRAALVKLVPLLLHQRNRIFSFQDSRFRMEKAKEATARLVAFREMNILNSYTLEASFCGPAHSAALENRNPAPGESSGNTQMTQSHLLSLGKDLCKTLLTFLNPRIFRRKLTELTALLTKEITPPAFKSREKQAAEQKASDKKALEDLEEPEAAFTIDCAMEEMAQQETLLEELAAEQGEEAKSILSDDALTDHEEDLPCPSLPTLGASQPVSVPAKRPVKVRHKAVRKSLDSTIDQPERSTANSTRSRMEEPRSAGLPPQPVRISSILRYYRDAEAKSHRPRPFSPVKLNTSAFPDISFFDTWRRKAGQERLQMPAEAAKSLSPERAKRAKVRARPERESLAETEEGGGVFESLRFSVPSTGRNALSLVSRSWQFRRQLR